MSHQSGPLPVSRPQMEMLTHVEALLGRHPRLHPVLERGWTLTLGCDDRAIWVDALGPKADERATARLETPRWWLPGRSGRALAIAEKLATSLQTEIEQVS